MLKYFEKAWCYIVGAQFAKLFEAIAISIGGWILGVC